MDNTNVIWLVLQISTASGQAVLDWHMKDTVFWNDAFVLASLIVF